MLLWALAADPRLSAGVRRAIRDPANDVFVSAASAWEIAIKRSLGKLQAPDDLEEQLDRARFSALPITIQHALVAGALERHHGDPFDRVLIAQALVEHLTVVTRDPRFEPYGVPVLPV
ncbi:MAG: type II toxin-antitoxin system VapC family toxin [Actinomycetota bacterium]|nr:type II toxin-antitoxin system VapC family toxin [Actinomycetota bacterium]